MGLATCEFGWQENGNSESMLIAILLRVPTMPQPLPERLTDKLKAALLAQGGPGTN